MRQYVVSYDYSGDGVNFTVADTRRMIAEIENAHYTGDAEDDERYYTVVDGELTEVTFKCTAHDGPDADDYLHYTYEVTLLADPDRVVDTFTVRIDGRA